MVGGSDNQSAGDVRQDFGKDVGPEKVTDRDLPFIAASRAESHCDGA